MSRSHKVSYRLARFIGERETPPMEELLRSILAGHHGSNYSARIFTVSDKATKAVVNRSEIEPPGLLAEIFQLDPRRTLPFLQHSPDPQPIAEVKSRAVPLDEDHMGAPAYFMLLGNHMALIESAGLRTAQIESYLNALLQSAEHLAPDEHWKLVPKIEVAEGEMRLERGVSRLEVKPLGRLIGDAPSQVDRQPKRNEQAKRNREEKLARGPKVLDLLKTLGASNAELEDLRAGLSADLGLEAKVVITVRHDARGTKATLNPMDIAKAVASLEEDNAITVVSPDGSQNGRLVSLSDQADIEDDGGLLNLASVTRALAAILRGWANRGIVEAL